MTPNHQRQDRVRIKHAAIQIALLPESDLHYFLDVFFQNIPPLKRIPFITRVCAYQFDDRGRWLKIEKWMDTCFSNHYNYTPKKVARMCCHFFKVNFRMEPVMIRKAQKIKNRVAKRRAYQICKLIEEEAKLF